MYECMNYNEKIKFLHIPTNELWMAKRGPARSLTPATSAVWWREVAYNYATDARGRKFTLLNVDLIKISTNCRWSMKCGEVSWTLNEWRSIRKWFRHGSVFSGAAHCVCCDNSAADETEIDRRSSWRLSGGQPIRNRQASSFELALIQLAFM